jgi:hypothetical protein
MAQVFTQRNRPPPAVLRYDLPDNVRKRIFLTLKQVGENDGVSVDSVLSELGQKLSAQYGDLSRPLYNAARQSDDPVVQHYLCCHDTVALDFIEFWFKCFAFHAAGQHAVEPVNQVLREEGIGYELSPWVERDSGRPASLFGRLTGSNYIETQYPEFIRKDSQFTHANIVQPCLDVLKNPVFAQANKEMLDAFAKHRHGDFDGALTACGAAFESVLKTICTAKKWAYDPDKDTLAKLVDICNAKGLFPPFYAEVFKSIGTVRNKLGDAHGRGPTPP